MAQVDTDEERKIKRRKDFARRVRHWRTSAGLRQVDLALEARMSESMVSRIESADAEASQDAQERIIIACGVSKQIFWGRLPAAEVAKC